MSLPVSVRYWHSLASSTAASSVQFICSVTSDSLRPCGLQHARNSLSITNLQILLKLMFFKSVMPSNHLILCHPHLLLPSILLSIRVFSNESVLCIRWPKYWSFSFSISPSNEYLGLISFRMDWFDLLIVYGTLKSLLQHHSSKTSILWCSAFFMVQLSYPYVTTGKTIALTKWTFVRQSHVTPISASVFALPSPLLLFILPSSLLSVSYFFLSFFPKDSHWIWGPPK